MTPISRTLAVGAAVLALAAAAPSMAQDFRTLAPGAVSPPATLDDLKRIAGDWAGEGAVAGFSAPAAGEVIGHLLLYTDKGPLMQELWLIRPDKGSLRVRQKHFSPDLSGLEDKAAWAERAFVGKDADHLYFDDMILETKGGTLQLWARLPGRGGGAPTILHYTMHKVR